MPGPDKRFTVIRSVSFTKEMWEFVQREAVKQGVSAGHIVRLAVMDYMKKVNRRKQS